MYTLFVQNKNHYVVLLEPVPVSGSFFHIFLKEWHSRLWGVPLFINAEYVIFLLRHHVAYIHFVCCIPYPQQSAPKS